MAFIFISDPSDKVLFYIQFTGINPREKTMKKSHLPYYKFTPDGITVYPQNKDVNYDKINKDSNAIQHQAIDIFKELKEWSHQDYNETSQSEHTEDYNGFRIEIRFSCFCHIYEDPECGLQFFIITPNNRYFTNSCIYSDIINACNDAYTAIDNGEIPE